MNDARFQLIFQGQRRGPFSEEEVLDLYRKGTINDETLACVWSRFGYPPPDDLRHWSPIRIWLPKILSEPRPDSGRNQTSLECFQCRLRLRIKRTATKVKYRCPDCGIAFFGWVDAGGVPQSAPCEDEKETDNKPDPEFGAFGSGLTAHQIIGVRPNATQDEIKKAYRSRIQEYHPDKVAALGNELKKVAEEMTKRINQAYRTLTKNS